jgi:hypothetical protein
MQRKGNTMLLPVLIFLMILSPVLIPAVGTAIHAAGRPNRPAGIVGYPRSLTSRRLAIPAAA